MEETLVGREHIYQGRVVGLRVDTVRLQSGRVTTREVVQHRGAVAIVPLTDEGHVLLVEQYRTPAEAVLLEIPAGTLEEGEDPLTCAHRELQEETGYTAAELIPLAAFYTCPGFCTEYIRVYLARGLHQGPQAADEDENIQVVRVPLAQALEMVKTGRICDAKSVIGLLLASSCG